MISNKMQIAIWSDIACPYCYIGKRKLEMALKEFPHSDQIELKWYSYELDPTLEKRDNNINYYEHIAQKYNKPIENVKKSNEKLVNLAKEVGLDFNFNKVIVTNTLDALRMVKLADKQGLATEMEEVLFRSYFTEGLCISDYKVLINLGKEIGLEEKTIEKMLNSEDFKEKILFDKERAEKRFKLNFIPFYKMGNFFIEGSIEIPNYLKTIAIAFQSWLSDDLSEGGKISGEACAADGSGCK